MNNIDEVAARATRGRDDRRGIGGKNVCRMTENYPTSGLILATFDE
jgi:hypothetical protein